MDKIIKLRTKAQREFEKLILLRTRKVVEFSKKSRKC